MAEFDATGSYRAAVGPHSVQRDVPKNCLSAEVPPFVQPPTLATLHRARAALILHADTAVELGFRIRNCLEARCPPSRFFF